MTGDGTVHQAPLLPVTTVGSLPKPAWLAEPEVLWSPWQLHGDVLADGKRDALRAVVQDTEISSAQGIRSHLMYPLGFGIGVALAAVAGALMAPVFSVSPSIGSTPLLKAFIVVILGGLGSIPGAALASLLLGVVESAANTFMSSSMSDMLLFGFVILMLIFRPSGLLGKSGR